MLIWIPVGCEHWTQAALMVLAQAVLVAHVLAGDAETTAVIQSVWLSVPHQGHEKIMLGKGTFYVWLLLCVWDAENLFVDLPWIVFIVLSHLNSPSSRTGPLLGAPVSIHLRLLNSLYQTDIQGLIRATCSLCWMAKKLLIPTRGPSSLTPSYAEVAGTKKPEEFSIDFSYWLGGAKGNGLSLTHGRYWKHFAICKQVFSVFEKFMGNLEVKVTIFLCKLLDKAALQKSLEK